MRMRLPAVAGAAQREAPERRPCATPAPDYGFPRGYKVEVSSDGAAWTTVAEGHDSWHDLLAIPSSGTGRQGESAATTIIAFKPVQARFVRITQTANAEGAPVWSIQSLRLYGAPAGRSQ